MELICIYKQLWWATKLKTSGTQLQDVMKFVVENLGRKYILINTGGHGDKNGNNPSTKKTLVKK